MGEREEERLGSGLLVCSLFAGLWREGLRRLEEGEVGESSRERERQQEKQPAPTMEGNKILKHINAWIQL